MHSLRSKPSRRPVPSTWKWFSYLVGGSSWDLAILPGGVLVWGHQFSSETPSLVRPEVHLSITVRHTSDNRCSFRSRIVAWSVDPSCLIRCPERAFRLRRSADAQIAHSRWWFVRRERPK